jgi:hypothetical protein
MRHIGEEEEGVVCNFVSRIQFSFFLSFSVDKERPLGIFLRIYIRKKSFSSTSK